MSTYDLRTALHIHLMALVYSDLTTLKPDEIFDPATVRNSERIRRGNVILTDPETIGFGHGVYSRMEADYQIDIWVPRKLSGRSGLAELDNLTDLHVTHFFPANGQGLALTRNSTTANIVRRPNVLNMGREGAYLRTSIDVPFYVEYNPS